jgi:hypothetical protein
LLIVAVAVAPAAGEAKGAVAVMVFEVLGRQSNIASAPITAPPQN